ncbi:uncharacterized protein LOC113324441 [Papaver somniferum]|uniref:uncharacterized protein LOC113324441 n=1 Tax=Papaver somniferum TaxID=3469 RepID=UPI000E6FCA15|nr:uncharacterized protein LOC113324441 [Papaver somniferum]
MSTTTTAMGNCFKERYFPLTTALHANKKKNSTWVWHNIQDIVPSSERVAREMSYIGEHCAVCQQGIETTSHILKDCHFSKAILLATPGESRSAQTNNNSIADWIESWFEDPVNQLVENWTVKMSNTLWEIWKARCKCVFENVKPNPISVIRSIQHLNDSTWKEMKRKIKHVSPTTAANNTHPLRQWIPPPNPYYLICCDTPYKKINDLHHSGIGLILRNFAGIFEKAKCSYANRLESAEQAESEGLLQAMEWDEELKLQHINFELDAQVIAEAVHKDHHLAAWENHSTILVIKEKLCNNPLWSCKFINRNCYKPADLLARHAKFSKLVGLGLTIHRTSLLMQS